VARTASPIRAYSTGKKRSRPAGRACRVPAGRAAAPRRAPLPNPQKQSAPLLKLLKPGEWQMNLPRRPHTCPRRHLGPYRPSKSIAAPGSEPAPDTTHARIPRVRPAPASVRACVPRPIQPNQMERHQMADDSKTSLSTTRKPLTTTKPVSAPTVEQQADVPF
jgi:hypothetical protein